MRRRLVEPEQAGSSEAATPRPEAGAPPEATGRGPSPARSATPTPGARDARPWRPRRAGSSAEAGSRPEAAAPRATLRDLLAAARLPGAREVLVAQILWLVAYGALPAFFLLYADHALGADRARRRPCRPASA